MLHFKCSCCGKGLKGREELAGKKLKCPGCGQFVLVPEPVGSFSPAPETPSRALPTQAPPPRPLDMTEAPTAPPPGEDATPPPAASAQQAINAERLDFLAPPLAADEIGRLGPYRVLKVLGAGGMGVVFKAQDPGLERMVALKAMLPALAASDSAKKRFLREARAAAAIKHPHIVTIFQVGEDRGAPFLAMEHLDGEPLDVRLKRTPKPTLGETLHVGRQTAEGLAAAHDKGLIHRDIKPANLWLESHPSGPATIKILDFGLARALSDQTQLTQQGAIIGTPAYMAPEQAASEEVDARCDLFSLGCVLYRMTTGVMPFQGKDTISLLSAIALNDPRPPAEVCPDVPAELSDLIMRLLAKDAKDRPASAREVAETLAEMEEEQGQFTTSPRRSGKMRTLRPPGSHTTLMAPAPGRRKLAISVSLVAVVLVALLSWAFWPRPEDPAPPNDGPPPPEFKGEWVQLFNGQDLTGWKVFPGEEEIFKAKGGMIHAVSGKTNSVAACLFTERGDYENFHCVVHFDMGYVNTNGGVYFRSSFEPGLNQNAYKIPLQSGKKAGVVTGYPTFNDVAPAKTGLRRLEIIAAGDRVITKVEGKVTADFVDKERRYARGHLALFRIPTGIAFSKVEILELPPGPGPFPYVEKLMKPAAVLEPVWTPLVVGNDRTLWKQQDTHGASSNSWKLVDGEVIGFGFLTRGSTTSLRINNRVYKDFEMKFEARTKSGKPGIWFRLKGDSATPASKKVDYLFVDVASDTAGGLYWKKGLRISILKAADFGLIQKAFKPNDYNAFHVKCVGRRCSVHMNGELMVEGEFPDIPEEGSVGLHMIDSGDFSAHNILIKELGER